MDFFDDILQKHLLELKLHKKDANEPGSFVQLVLDAVKVLSG